jgi:hypothetical protein
MLCDGRLRSRILIRGSEQIGHGAAASFNMFEVAIISPEVKVHIENGATPLARRLGEKAGSCCDRSRREKLSSVNHDSSIYDWKDPIAEMSVLSAMTAALQ